MTNQFWGNLTATEAAAFDLDVAKQRQKEAIEALRALSYAFSPARIIDAIERLGWTETDGYDIWHLASADDVACLPEMIEISRYALEDQAIGD